MAKVLLLPEAPGAPGKADDNLDAKMQQKRVSAPLLSSQANAFAGGINGGPVRDT